MTIKTVRKPNKLKGNGHILGAAVLFAVVVVLSFFKLKWYWALPVDFALLFCAWRLFFGKLKLHEGDVVLFWGLPGSGKTMFENKVALDNKKTWHIAGNNEFADVSSLCEYRFNKEHFGRFEPVPESALIIDEASLAGWDNRDWTNNFDEFSLEFWKKIRHYHCCAVLGNQGFGELDCKIRDSLTSVVYYVENKGLYSRAVRMDRAVTFDDNGLPCEGYVQPSFWSRMFDPSSVLYCWHAKYGKYYSTYNPKQLPSIRDVDNFVYIPASKSNRVGQWVRKEVQKEEAQSGNA